MISPLAFVDPGAKLGDNVTVHPFAYIGADAEIGNECVIMPFASVMGGSRLGNNIKVYNGAIIGADPQDFRWKGEKTYCYVDDNTVVREQVIINRGIYPEKGTRIWKGCFLMAETHVGHDSVVADNCVLGNGVQVAGDVNIGTCTILSTGAKVNAGSRIADWVFVKGGCRISGNVPPYVIVAHNPAVYYGVNAEVMRIKQGLFSEERIDDIAKAYRHIYQCNISIFNAMKRIEADVPQSPERDEILNFIHSCDNKIIALPKLDY